MERILSRKIVGIITCILLIMGAMYIGSQNVYAASKPAKVSLKSVQAATNKVNIAWKKVSKNCTGYQVYRSKKSKSGFVVVATLNDKTKTSYADKTIEPCTKYYYKVRAFNKYEMKVTQYYNSKTCEWVDEQPISEEWVGEETRVVPVEKYAYGAYSKTKNVKTKKMTVSSTGYNCYRYGDSVYFTNGITLFKYDINSERVTDTQLPCYWGFVPYGDCIYTSNWGCGIVDDEKIWSINLTTLKTKTLIKDASSYQIAIKDNKIYYSSYRNLAQWQKKWFDDPSYKLISDIKCYNLKTGKKAVTNKIDKIKYVTKETNDPDYRVNRKEGFNPFCLVTPNKTVVVSDVWNMN